MAAGLVRPALFQAENTPPGYPVCLSKTTSDAAEGMQQNRRVSRRLLLAHTGAPAISFGPGGEGAPAATRTALVPLQATSRQLHYALQ